MSYHQKWSAGKHLRNQKKIQQPDPEAIPITPDKHLQDYLDFLLKQGASMSKVCFAEFKTKNGLPFTGIMAREKIVTNDVFMRIPVHLVLNTCKAFFSEIREIFEENPHFFSGEYHDQWEDNVLWVYLLYENQKGPNSFWYHMLQNLSRDIDYLAFWPEEEIKQIEDRTLISITHRYQREYEEDYALLKEVLDRYCPRFFKDKEAYNYANAKWIFIHLVTRCFGRYFAYISMVPLAEFLNHENTNVCYEFDYNHLNNKNKPQNLEPLGPPKEVTEEQLNDYESSDCSNRSWLDDSDSDYDYDLGDYQCNSGSGQEQSQIKGAEKHDNNLQQQQKQVEEEDQQQQHGIIIKQNVEDDQQQQQQSAEQQQQKSSNEQTQFSQNSSNGQTLLQQQQKFEELSNQLKERLQLEQQQKQSNKSENFNNNNNSHQQNNLQNPSHYSTNIVITPAISNSTKSSTTATTYSSYIQQTPFLQQSSSSLKSSSSSFSVNSKLLNEIDANIKDIDYWMFMNLDMGDGITVFFASQVYEELQTLRGEFLRGENPFYVTKNRIRAMQTQNFIFKNYMFKYLAALKRKVDVVPQQRKNQRKLCFERESKRCTPYFVPESLDQETQEEVKQQEEKNLQDCKNSNNNSNNNDTMNSTNNDSSNDNNSNDKNKNNTSDVTDNSRSNNSKNARKKTKKYFAEENEWRQDKFDDVIMRTSEYDQFEANSQVYFCYGRLSNRALLSRYGVALEYNKYDHVFIRLEYIPLLKMRGYQEVIRRLQQWKNVSKYKVFKLKRNKFCVDLLFHLRARRWLMLHAGVERLFWIFDDTNSQHQKLMAKNDKKEQITQISEITDKNIEVKDNLGSENSSTQAQQQQQQNPQNSITQVQQQQQQQQQTQQNKSLQPNSVQKYIQQLEEQMDEDNSSCCWGLDFEIECLEEMAEVCTKFEQTEFSCSMEENEKKLFDKNLGYHEYFATIYRVERQRNLRVQARLALIAAEILRRVRDRAIAIEYAALLVPQFETQEEMPRNRVMLIPFFDRFQPTQIPVNKKNLCLKNNSSTQKNVGKANISLQQAEGGQDLAGQSNQDLQLLNKQIAELRKIVGKKNQEEEALDDNNNNSDEEDQEEEGEDNEDNEEEQQSQKFEDKQKKEDNYCNNNDIITTNINSLTHNQKNSN